MVETIFKGATRPSMKYGVPLAPLLAVVLPAMLGGLWLSVLVHAALGLLVFGTAAVAVFWMRWVTARDDQRLMQVLLLLKLRLWNRNASLRNGLRSYSIFSYQRSAHVWRR